MLRLAEAAVVAEWLRRPKDGAIIGQAIIDKALFYGILLLGCSAFWMMNWQMFKTLYCPVQLRILTRFTHPLANPLVSLYGSVGSNPTDCKYFFVT